MSTRPKLLDLFCGAGGCSVGYHRAGFDVTGVDLRSMPRYPFEFHQADALQFLADHGQEFDVIHASPPCQAYSVANNIHGRADHPDLVDATRAALQATGKLWVIENVPGAPLRNYVTLCGLSFGLGVKRHRWFESNALIMTSPCGRHEGDWVLVFGHTVLERSGQVDRNTPSGGPRYRRRHLGTHRGREAMGIDWMSRDELSEAIPPAYTEHIGTQLLDQLALQETP